MSIVLKLTTLAACRVARINRDRLNEHVALGHFQCAPVTVPGRARLFDPDDMIALWLFRELMEDGFDAASAGVISCAVGSAARCNPTALAISYVEIYAGTGNAYPADEVPAASEWEHKLFSGSDIRKVTTFNIAKIRRLVAHGTEVESSIIGERDGE